MASLLSVGQGLRGRLSTYSIVKELHKAADQGAVFLAMNQTSEKCIVRSIRGHWLLQNEAEVLKRYQDKTPFLRPLLDQIVEPSDPPSIVLKHLDTDLLTESNRKRLSCPEIKQVAKCVLQALQESHRDGVVHTDKRFSEIQLGDCGGVVSQDSEFAKGHLIDAGFTRSPEAAFQIPWGTATDIWSFGNAILSLLYGGNYHLFNPAIDKVRPEDDLYELTVLKRMYKFFGPFPESYKDFNDEETMIFREIPPADKSFILKIMKLDPRDRPTAQQLLQDEWLPRSRKIPETCFLGKR
ncbi:kinase-like domain-containing protein [Chaetomium strumarium]|uniref:Kinase-like domain-containing protein n=1 Tax=Chaetomium strumarium TaxID=1170767 RepID=A0AAJ0GU85_9PEZI|nr:kinase-like domain-containing protein [Chaetomium strumarium]